MSELPPPLAPRAPLTHPDAMVIGLSGPGGAGKSTVARAMAEVLRLSGRSDVHIFPIASPIKAGLAAILSFTSATPEEIASMIDGDLKRDPSPHLAGRTPTHAMQTLGTEWGREAISARFWLDIWRARTLEVLERGGVVINDSVRFENEAEEIASLGGLVVRLTGRAGNLAPNHVSERHTLTAYEVDNSGIPRNTARAVLAAAESHRMGR